MEAAKNTYIVTIEQDEDGMYVAEVPAIAGCYTQGKTIDEAMNRIREAVSACSKDENVKPLKFVRVQQIQA